MWVAEVPNVERRVRFGDLVVLGKPRLSSLVICTAAGGMWLAPGGLGFGRSLVTIFATALLVACANALNCVLEVGSDAQMKRTRQRPLAAGRLESRPVWFGAWTLAAACVAALALAANPLTAALGAVALLSYVLVYTPMKRKSSLALFVGGIPGALPPLMGWTALTGTIDVTGLVLFAILFLWQLPHFMAISVYLGDDYARGGMRVFSLVHGERVTKWSIVLTTLVLVPVPLALLPLGVAGPLYGWMAAILGAGLFAWTLRGVRSMPIKRWARRVFIGTLAYLTLLLSAIAVGAT